MGLTQRPVNSTTCEFVFSSICWIRNPEWKKNVAATLRSIIRSTSARTLFSEVGLGVQKGLISETSELILSRWIPKPAQDSELSELFLRIFKTEEDSIWVSHITSNLLGQLRELIQEDPSPFLGWLKDVEESVILLGGWISAMGTRPEVMARLYQPNPSALSFVRLNYQLVLLFESKQKVVDISHLKSCLDEIQKCRADIKKVYAALNFSGVSVGLVYTLENLSRSLARVEHLLNFLLPPSDETPTRIISFLATLVRERIAQSTVSNIIRSNVHLISSKIVERAGTSGEHYITRTREEYFEMLRKGLGGGGIMVFTTLIKYAIAGISLPLFFQGLFFSINYSSGFLILQLLGFTLATKQPSATASALAGKLSQVEEEADIREFVNEVCRMTRTQFAALVGNLVFLVPFATILDFSFFFITKHHFFSKDFAPYVLQSLHPFKSFTIPMAILTGVFLWLSSLAAGWLENWIVFRRIPEGIASQRRLIQVFGEKGAKKIGDWLLKNATLLGGNISLGFLMGFASTFGKFVGLPLDVRHVTLSAAALTFSACALAGKGFPWTSLILPFVGVILIGLINFTVGYTLAFAVAVRAREVKLVPLLRLFRALRVRVRYRARDFVLAPEKDFQ